MAASLLGLSLCDRSGGGGLAAARLRRMRRGGVSVGGGACLGRRRHLARWEAAASRSEAAASRGRRRRADGSDEDGGLWLGMRQRWLDLRQSGSECGAAAWFADEAARGGLAQTEVATAQTEAACLQVVLHCLFLLPPPCTPAGISCLAVPVAHWRCPVALDPLSSTVARLRRGAWRGLVVGRCAMRRFAAPAALGCPCTLAGIARWRCRGVPCHIFLPRSRRPSVARPWRGRCVRRGPESKAARRRGRRAARLPLWRP